MASEALNQAVRTKLTRMANNADLLAEIVARMGEDNAAALNKDLTELDLVMGQWAAAWA